MQSENDHLSRRIVMSNTGTELPNPFMQLEFVDPTLTESDSKVSLCLYAATLGVSLLHSFPIVLSQMRVGLSLGRRN